MVIFKNIAPGLEGLTEIDKQHYICCRTEFSVGVEEIKRDVFKRNTLQILVPYFAS